MQEKNSTIHVIIYVISFYLMYAKTRKHKDNKIFCAFASKGFSCNLAYFYRKKQGEMLGC